jgi:hypothetical protein
VPVGSVPVLGKETRGCRTDPTTFFLPDLAFEADEQADLHLAGTGVDVRNDSAGAKSRHDAYEPSALWIEFARTTAEDDCVASVAGPGSMSST